MTLFQPLCSSLLLVALFVSSSTHASNPHLLDQRDPAYQKAIEHLARAHQALSVAQQELGNAQAAYQLPGLNVERMRDQLAPLEDTLRVLLSPEKKRQAHETLVPDGIFFTPVQTGD